MDRRQDNPCIVRLLFPQQYHANSTEEVGRHDQGKRRVMEYARDIEALARKFKETNERQVILKFWKGLNSNIRGDMALLHVDPERDSLERALKQAMKCEKAREERAYILKGERDYDAEPSGSCKPKREWTRFKNRAGGTVKYKPGGNEQAGNKSGKIQANAMSPQIPDKELLKEKPQEEKPHGGKKPYGKSNGKPPYDKNKNKNKGNQLSRAQLDTLRAEGRCFNCKDTGHKQLSQVTIDETTEGRNQGGSNKFCDNGKTRRNFGRINLRRKYVNRQERPDRG